ncbi:ATP-binding protein [Massilia pseudoviolaceinigra]|uniref:ATP-binding protein n=1 Tax=Massilia pseudoviolaceinigra TaxID=3057165 RepID=UPI0035B55814
MRVRPVIMRRANFRNQRTLDGFDFDRLPGLNRAAVHDLATCRFIDDKVAELIAGLCCTGKSHLAQSLPRARAMTCCSPPRLS